VIISEQTREQNASENLCESTVYTYLVYFKRFFNKMKLDVNKHSMC